MNLHVFFHGMMVFDDRTDWVTAVMPTTPNIDDGALEHEYLLYTSSVDEPIALAGDYTVKITMAAAPRADFSDKENVLFEKGTNIGNSHVKVTLPAPHLISGVRFCEKVGRKDFFENAPNNPDRLPTAHVLSYSNVTAVTVIGPKGFEKAVVAEGDAFKIAFHSEEPTFDVPKPNHNGHLRHIRAALGKIGFKYVTAMAAPKARAEEIMTDKIEEFWSESIPEKLVRKQLLSPPSPDDSESPTEDNPCFRYVVTNR